MPVLTEELTRLKGHRWQISCLSFSPDGSLLASGGWDKEVHLWDLSNLEVVHTLKGVHKVPVTSVCWHRPNGRLVCTGSADHNVALWDADTGDHLSTLREHVGWVLGSCFSTTGSFLATSSWDKTVRIWDPGSEMLINTLNGHAAGVWSVDFHPRSSLLCSASEDGTVKIWDARSNRTVRTLSGGHTDAVYCARWSPDGALIASGSADTKICIWEPGTGAVINTIYGHVDTVKNIVFNPQTENVALPVLASVGDFTIRLSDPRPDHKSDILTLSPHLPGKEVEAVTISPDGSLLISGGRDGLIVLMTLFVPSIMPRSESSFLSTSSVLRKSRVVRDRSYIYDATEVSEIPEELDEEDELEAELEAEALDRMLTKPKEFEKKTSFTRMKRRSRVAEKEVELLDHATLKRKGVHARVSREKRIKAKQVDIPTMIAHLSAAIRAYGPEEVNSSSSESEEENEAEEVQEQLPPSKSAVDVASKVAAFTNSEALVIDRDPPKIPPSSIGKLKDRKDVFERQDLPDTSPTDDIEREFLKSMPGELENTLQREYNFGESTSTNFDESFMHASVHYSVRAPDYFNSSLQFDDFNLGESFDDQHKAMTSSPLHTPIPKPGDPTGRSDHKRPRGFVPTLPPSAEYDEERFAQDIGSGDEYGDEVPLSMI